MTDQEWYDYGQAHCGIEVGDSVRVLRKAKDDEMGWDNVWSSNVMDEFIGQTPTVEEINNTGISCRLEGRASCWLFPFFVLELIQKAEPKSSLPQSILNIIEGTKYYDWEKEALKKLVAEILKQK